MRSLISFPISGHLVFIWIGTRMGESVVKEEEEIAAEQGPNAGSDSLLHASGRFVLK